MNQNYHMQEDRKEKFIVPMQRKDLVLTYSFWDQLASHDDLPEKVLENFVTASV